MIEHRKGEGSFLGASLMSGYQSHFVVTDKTGDPCSPSSTEYFTEFVIPQVRLKECLVTEMN